MKIWDQRLRGHVSPQAGVPAPTPLLGSVSLLPHLTGACFGVCLKLMHGREWTPELDRVLSFKILASGWPSLWKDGPCVEKHSGVQPRSHRPLITKIPTSASAPPKLGVPPGIATSLPLVFTRVREMREDSCCSRFTERNAEAQRCEGARPRSRGR